MRRIPVLILGAGIGGLTCAIALHQRGIRAEIVEQAPELREVGAGIWLPTNAMTVLDRLGLAGELATAGIALERIELADGVRLLQAIDLGPVRARHGHTTISILRRALQAVLAGAIEPDTLRLGARVERVEADGRVHLAGGEVLESEVVIGADGIHSVARAAVCGEVTLRYSGQTCYRGVAPIALDDVTRRICREVYGPGGEARIGYSAVGADQVYWFLPVRAPRGERDETPVKPRLEAIAAGFPAPIPAIVAATPAEAISRLDLCDLETPARWHAGHVVLLGDAAHAMTPNLGQGGAQAIEDGFVLAACLADHATPEAAFAAYQEHRRPRVRRIAKLAWRIGRMAHASSGVARGLRNLAMRAVPGAIARRQLDWLYTAGIPGPR
jgi:2-polyprenyl-6-methoxyphenol hydroxylase-like FAD-dependent oxidoreductase